MTQFDTFFNQYQGQFVEKEDSSALNQCMDLIFAYMDYLGIDRAAVRHPMAYQVWANPTDLAVAHFWFVPSTPTNAPATGDIVVWSSAYNGGAGHIGIANGRADANSLDVFEQNDPLKSPAHVKTYGYTNIYGWLTLKQAPVDTSALQQQITQLQNKINNAKNALA